ncbi:hypothetical protein [Aquisphaera insulae]|uniref:hypothetical protein n=1 Tax=Aquisphaera insulae TaxID=2712864 RepID=UPI0013ECE96A|nr:hypothetical protein [Aquisphaera insulae]
MRIGVILHERHDSWARQLRPRLAGRPVRWLQTRSPSDLKAAMSGLACPVVLIDLARDLAGGMAALDRLQEMDSSVRILVLDPDEVPGIRLLARELGATHVVSGFAPPPAIADLLDAWIAQAIRRAEHEGWSRRLEPEEPEDAEGWIEAVIHRLETAAAETIA